MIKLINRGRYDRPVQDEFDHIVAKFATYMSQVFDENGVYNPPPLPPGVDDPLEGVTGPEGPPGPQGPQGIQGPQGPAGATGVTNVRSHQGDIFISNGLNTGTSTLPWATVDRTRVLLVFLGGVGQNDGAIYWDPAVNNRLIGRRLTTAVDGTLYYSVMEFLP